MLGNGMSFSQQPQSMFGQNPFNVGVDIQSLQKPGNLLSSGEKKPSGLEKFGKISSAIGDALMYLTAAMPGPSQQGAASLLAMSNAQKEKAEDRKAVIQKMFAELLAPKSEMGKMAADFGMTPEKVAELKRMSSHGPAGDPYAQFMLPIVKSFSEQFKNSLNPKKTEDESLGDYDIFGNPI